MVIKARDFRLLSIDDLNRYIIELKVQHDRAVARTHTFGVEACKDQIREVEEELCWAEHEAARRFEASGILYRGPMVSIDADRR